MSYEAQKCPLCGTIILVQSDGKNGFCSYCGSRREHKDAIAAYKLDIEIRDPVKVEGISSVENDLLHGEQCLRTKEWARAYYLFAAAIDKDAENARAWFGCLRAMTAEFTEFQDSLSCIDGEKGIIAVIKNCLRYGEDRYREQVVMKIRAFSQRLTEEFYAAQAEKNNAAKTSAISKALIALCFGIAILLLFSGTMIIWLLLLVGLAFCFNLVKKFQKKITHRVDQVYNESMLNRLVTMKEALRYGAASNNADQV